tara:strand:- start:180 stop:530 length:351 start_codon:yes stop_codon:yes gene_type:complete
VYPRISTPTTNNQQPTTNNQQQNSRQAFLAPRQARSDMRTRGPQCLVSIIHPLLRPRRHWHARGPGCRLAVGVLKPPINLPRGVRQGVLGADGADLGLGKRRLQGQVGAEEFFRVL